MITIKRILVPRDLSTVSVPAIGYAISLAQDRDAEVILLNVQAMEADEKALPGRLRRRGRTYKWCPCSGPTAARHRQLLRAKRTTVSCFRPAKDRSRAGKAVKIRPLVKLGKIVEEILCTRRTVRLGRDGERRRPSETLVRWHDLGADCQIRSMPCADDAAIGSDPNRERSAVEG